MYIYHFLDCFSGTDNRGGGKNIIRAPDMPNANVRKKAQHRYSLSALSSLSFLTLLLLITVVLTMSGPFRNSPADSHTELQDYFDTIPVRILTFFSFLGRYLYVA